MSRLSNVLIFQVPLIFIHSTHFFSWSIEIILFLCQFFRWSPLLMVIEVIAFYCYFMVLGISILGSWLVSTDFFFPVRFLRLKIELWMPGATTWSFWHHILPLSDLNVNVNEIHCQLSSGSRVFGSLDHNQQRQKIPEHSIQKLRLQIVHVFYFSPSFKYLSIDW